MSVAANKSMHARGRVCLSLCMLEPTLMYTAAA